MSHESYEKKRKELQRGEGKRKRTAAEIGAEQNESEDDQPLIQRQNRLRSTPQTSPSRDSPDISTLKEYPQPQHPMSEFQNQHRLLH